MIRAETMQRLQTLYEHVEEAHNQEIQAYTRQQMTAPLGNIERALGKIEEACQQKKTAKLHDYLGSVAEKTETVRQLADALTEPFTLFIIGNGNNGKSTLINALLGQQQAEEGKLPKTWKIDIFQQRSKNLCTLTFRDGTKKELSPKDTQKFLTEEEQKCRASSKAIKKEIRDFKRTHAEVPFEVCEEKEAELKKYKLYRSPVIEVIWPVTDSPILAQYRLVDTPGLKQELDSKITDSVKDYFTKADGVIWILPGDKINSSGDSEELKKLYDGAEKKPNNIVAVVNRMDLVRENGQDVDAVVAEAKKLYGSMITDIIPISAKAAKDAAMILQKKDVSPEERKKGEALWQSSNMAELLTLLKRTFLSHALELQLQSKTENAKLLYQDISLLADGAAQMLKKADKEREKKKSRWEKDSSEMLERLKQELKNFEEREAGRVAQETSRCEESLWNMESEARNNYILHRIIRPDQLERSLHDLVQSHCRQLSEAAASHLKRAPFREFPALHELQVQAHTSSDRAVSATVLDDDLSDEGTAQFCLGGALAIGAAALLGPVGILFAGVAFSDFGRSVAKWLSRTFGDSLSVKVRRRVESQLDKAVEKLYQEYEAYIKKADVSVTKLREETYCELYGPSEAHQVISRALSQLGKGSTLRLEPLTVKEIIFSKRRRSDERHRSISQRHKGTAGTVPAVSR